MEIDVIWDKWHKTLEPLRDKLNSALKKSWQDWEIPRDADAKWSEATKKLHADWWQARIARQKEIDASIAAKAEFGDENVHRVRALMDEVFGEQNCVSMIGFAKTTGSTEDFLGQTTDFLLWYGKDRSRVKYRPALKRKRPGEKGGTNYNRVRRSK